MPDVIVIGAGPAGLAATAELTRTGLGVTLVDENSSLGGQIYRGLEGNAAAGRMLFGADYFAGLPLIAGVEDSGADLRLRATAWSVVPTDGGFEVALTEADATAARRTVLLPARAVLIATGALERPFPIPGWTLPGVMTAGAAQSFLKAGGLVPESPAIIAGTGPLIYLLAAQYLRAGAPAPKLLLTTPRRNLPAALRGLPAFLASPYAVKGAALLAELMGRGILTGVEDLEASGEGALAEVSFSTRGKRQRLPATTLFLHQGVVPQTSLAMAAGCRYAWNPLRLAYEPVLGSSGETSVPGLYVAGDSAGIVGATAAAANGRLVGYGIASTLRGRRDGAADPRVAALRRNLRHQLQGRGFVDALYRPAAATRIPCDAVVVCRCESVTAGAVRAACRGGTTGPNQVKIFTRAGMGPCQGRECSLTVSEIIASTLGMAMEEVGHARLRFPAKPVTVGELAALHTAGHSRHGKLFS